jgi:hypothetical protein
MIDRADDNYELNIDKARRVLGWQPKHSLRETLPTMLEGLKLDPEKWYKLNKLHFPKGHHPEYQLEPLEPAEPAQIADQGQVAGLLPGPSTEERVLIPPHPADKAQSDKVA